jgi:radical SAM superfamily enzyme YgiQ (UPF0313 family)
MNIPKSSNGSFNKIAFVWLTSEYHLFDKGLIMPDYGHILMATVLKQNGYDVTAFVDKLFPKIDWKMFSGFNAVCMTPMTPSASKSLNLAKQIKMNLGIPVIAGGAFPTYYPEIVLKYFDYGIRKEGEESLVELLQALEAGSELENIRGISFRKDNMVYVTPERNGLEKVPNIIPDYSLIKNLNKYSTPGLLLRKQAFWMNTLQTSRGCPFRCSFCVTPDLFQNKFNLRDIDNVIEDIKF